MKKRLLLFLLVQLTVSFTVVLAGKLSSKISSRIARENELKNEYHSVIRTTTNDSRDSVVHLEDVSDVKDFSRIVHMIAINNLEEIDISDEDDTLMKKWMKKRNSSKMDTWKIDSLNIDSSKIGLSKTDSLEIDSMKIDSSKETRALQRKISNISGPFDSHRIDKIETKTTESSNLANETFRFLANILGPSKMSVEIKENLKVLLHRIVKIQGPVKKVNHNRHIDREAQEISNEEIGNDDKVPSALEDESKELGKNSISKKSVKKNHTGNNEISEFMKNETELTEPIFESSTTDEISSNRNLENILSLENKIKDLENKINTSRMIIDESTRDIYFEHETTQAILSNKVTNEEILKTGLRKGDVNNYTSMTVIDKMASEESEKVIENTTNSNFLVNSIDNSRTIEPENSKITTSSNNEKVSMGEVDIVNTTTDEIHSDSDQISTEEKECESSSKVNTHTNLNINNFVLPFRIKNNNRTTDIVSDVGTTRSFGSEEIYNITLRKNQETFEKKLTLHDKKIDKPTKLKKNPEKLNNINPSEETSKSLGPYLEIYTMNESVGKMSDETLTPEIGTLRTRRQYVMDVLLESINSVIELKRTKLTRSQSHEGTLNA